MGVAVSAVSFQDSERESLRTTRRAIERVLLLAGVPVGRLRAVGEMVLHAQLQWGEGIGWLLDEPEVFDRSAPVALSERGGVTIADCGAQPSVSVGFDLLDLMSVRALTADRAICVVVNVLRPHLLRSLTPIARRRGVALTVAPIDPATGKALGAVGRGEAAPVWLMLAAADPDAGDSLCAARSRLAGSPTLARAVQHDVWLPARDRARLLDRADLVLVPDAEHTRLDAGVVPDAG